MNTIKTYPNREAASNALDGRKPELVVIQRNSGLHPLPISIADGEQLVHAWPGMDKFYTFNEAVELAMLHDDQQAAIGDEAARALGGLTV